MAQVFSCEFRKIFKNIFFTEHLWMTAFLNTIFGKVIKTKLVNNYKSYVRKKKNDKNAILQLIHYLQEICLMTIYERLSKEYWKTILRRCSLRFRNIHWRTLVLESHFNKVAGLNVCNFFKRRLQPKCFPANIANF